MCIKRIITVLAVMALMAAMMVVTASAAFADPKVFTGGGSQLKGATVFHCGPFYEGVLEVKGNAVGTPSGNQGGSGCYEPGLR